MRICYVGNYKHSWCTEVHVARDAERIPGVIVDRVQEPPWMVTKQGSGGQWPVWLERLERRASECDLLIYQRTWGVPPEAIVLWHRLEARGVRTISYHLDLYRGLKREASVIGDPFWSTGVVFTADGDPATTDWLRSLDVDHRWMPAAVVSDEVYLVPDAHRARGPKVVFVGSHSTYHDEWPWRQTLLASLRSWYGPDFRTYPTNGVRVHGASLNALYSGAPVTAGDSLALPGHVGYWSDRFYEVVGRGGVLVGPRVPGIETQFVDGEHLVLYELGDVDDVRAKIDALLDDPERRQRIRVAGVEHVRAHHTYTHRVRSMLASLGLEISTT